MTGSEQNERDTGDLSPDPFVHNHEGRSGDYSTLRWAGLGCYSELPVHLTNPEMTNVLGCSSLESLVPWLPNGAFKTTAKYGRTVLYRSTTVVVVSRPGHPVIRESRDRD